MSAMLMDALSGDIAQRVGWALVHFLWQGVAVAMLLAAVLQLLNRRSPQARYGAACCGLAVLAALPIVTAAMIAPVATNMPNATPASPAVPANAYVYAPASSKQIAAQGHEQEADASSEYPDSAAVGREAVLLPAADGGLRAGDTPLIVAPAAATPAKAVWPQRLRAIMLPLLPWGVLAWLAGVVGLSLWHLSGWLLLQRIRRMGAPLAQAELVEAFQRLRQRLTVSRPVRLLESALVTVPVVIGWLRPIILLPACAFSGLTASQVEAILAHELAHIRRWDCLVRMIQAAVETVLFYHPAVWWVSSRIRQESENCCDELAVHLCGDRRGYAMALAAVAGVCGPGASLTAGAGGGKLLPRLRRILGRADRRPSATRHLAGLSIAASLLIAALVIGCSVHQLSQQRASAAAPVAARASTTATDSPPATGATEPATQAVTPSGVGDWAQAIRTAADGWVLEQAGAAPSVEIEGQKGYRLTLRMGEKYPMVAGNSQQRASQGTNAAVVSDMIAAWWYMDLVLLPRPLKNASKLGWPEREGEAPPYFTKVVHLGHGMGMEWYARATLFDQETLRAKLKLEDGDDRLALLIEAMKVEDTGSCTRNSCELLLANFGDKALPYIRAAVDGGGRGLEAIRPLAHIRTEAATDYLKALYQAQPTRSAAEYALVREPFRKEAKEQYLDMLRTRSRVFEPAQACVKFGWKEAVPFLNAVYAQPQSLYEFEAAFQAKRALEGAPMADVLRKLQQDLQSAPYAAEPIGPEALSEAKATLLASKDTEAVAVIAVQLALCNAKASNDRQEPLRKLGRDVLQSLPRQLTRPMVQRLLAQWMEQPFEREQLAKLLDLLPVSSTSATGPSSLSQTAPSLLPEGWDGKRLLEALAEHIARLADEDMKGYELTWVDNRQIRLAWRTQEQDVLRATSKIGDRMEVRREIGPVADGLIVTIWLQDGIGAAVRPQTFENGKWATYGGPEIHIAQLKPLPEHGERDKVYAISNIDYGPQTRRELIAKFTLTPAMIAAAIARATAPAGVAASTQPATAPSAAPAEPSAELLADIRSILPEKWEFSVINEPGKMGHPHGLGEPVFRIDFVKPSDSFDDTRVPGKVAKLHPSLRLHFHRIADKQAILETIKAESIRSWDIPIYFSETPDYLVVTSPGWINQGVYTQDARTLVFPLESAIKTRRHWTPSPAAFANANAPWGGAAAGIQLRLLTRKLSWYASQTPEFTTHVLKDGKPFTYQWGDVQGNEIELDGRLYSVGWDDPCIGRFDLDSSWRDKIDRAPLVLKPGKHRLTMRVPVGQFLVRDAAAGASDANAAPMRYTTVWATSNTVEFEIVDGGGTPLPGPATTAASPTAADPNAPYRELYAAYKALILKAAQAGDANKVQKLTDTFNASIDRNLLHSRVTIQQSGKFITLISKFYTDPPLLPPNIHYASIGQTHVTRQDDYVLIETAKQSPGKDGGYEDDIYIVLAVNPLWALHASQAVPEALPQAVRESSPQATQPASAPAEDVRWGAPVNGYVCGLSSPAVNTVILTIKNVSEQRQFFYVLMKETADWIGLTARVQMDLTDFNGQSIKGIWGGLRIDAARQYLMPGRAVRYIFDIRNAFKIEQVGKYTLTVRADPTGSNKLFLESPKLELRADPDGPAVTAAHEAKLAEVKNKAAKVVVGMRRSEVELLFGTMDGGIQGPDVSRYYEDPEVMIEIPFDQTGGNWSKKNRVTGAPKIYRSLMHGD